MASTLTNNFGTMMAQKVMDLVDVGANSYLPTTKQRYYYVVVGKQLPWNSGTEVVPTSPAVTPNDLNNRYRYGVYAKLIEYENAAVVIPRIDWEANTVYNTYESNSNFYIVNSSYQVFKCLSNVATGTTSTDEPELTLSTTSLEEPYVKTADGYKWKYLYTISSKQKQRFMDDTWMPVYTNPFVSAASVPGGIDVIRITNSGNNYTEGSLQDIITITGDGTGATAKANVVGGHIVDVIVQERGTNYTTATLSFNDVTGGTGTGAAATVSISPVLGHGYEPMYELNANTIMFNVEVDGTEGDTYPADNDFRQVSVIYNPLKHGSSSLATETTYTLYTKIKTSPGLGDFSNDERVYQGTTYEDSTFSADVISFDEVQNYLYVNNIQGTLNLNQAIKGYNSGSIRVAVSNTDPEMKLYSGKMIYISDKAAVARDQNQLDRLRLIISF